MIDKNIFFTCKDKLGINDDFKKNIEFIKSQNPNYICHIVDNNDFENMIKEKNLEWYKCFKKLNPKYGAMIGDYIRYCLLYWNGGVYYDLKSRTLKPLNQIIKPNDKGIVTWWSLSNSKFHPQMINWLLIFQKEDKFLEKLIEDINQSILNFDKSKHETNRNKRQSVIDFTGPNKFTSVFLTYNKKSNYRMLSQKERLESFKYTCLKSFDSHKTLYQSHYSKVKEGDLVI